MRSPWPAPSPPSTSTTTPPPTTTASIASSAAASDVDSTTMRIGRYDVVREIRSGGMARAMLCRADDGGFVVAKVPIEDDAMLFARMRDEARVGQRLRHPHLVETIELVTNDDGRPVLVVGFVKGASLNDVRRTA